MRRHQHSTALPGARLLVNAVVRGSSLGRRERSGGCCGIACTASEPGKKQRGGGGGAAWAECMQAYRQAGRRTCARHLRRFRIDAQVRQAAACFALRRASLQLVSGLDEVKVSMSTNSGRMAGVYLCRAMASLRMREQS